ncbi:hypothetical protein F4803DRAFT_509396, partial [Xylaria telfairii]
MPPNEDPSRYPPSAILHSPWYHSQQAQEGYQQAQQGYQHQAAASTAPSLPIRPDVDSSRPTSLIIPPHSPWHHHHQAQQGHHQAQQGHQQVQQGHQQAQQGYQHQAAANTAPSVPIQPDVDSSRPTSSTTLPHSPWYRHHMAERPNEAISERPVILPRGEMLSSRRLPPLLPTPRPRPPSDRQGYNNPQGEPHNQQGEPH